MIVLRCALLLCALLQLASLGAAVEIEEIKTDKESNTAVQHENVFIDAEQLRAIIVGAMNSDFKERKIANETKDVKIGLLSSLFPEPEEEKKQKMQQQMEEKIQELFDKGIFDEALPNMILKRIDQLAQRFHMEPLEKKMEKADRAYGKQPMAENVSTEKKSDEKPTEEEIEPRTRLRLYRAAEAIRIHFSKRDDVTELASNSPETMVEELTMAELAYKIDMQLGKNFFKHYYFDRDSKFEMLQIYLRYNIAEPQQRISLDSRFAHLKIVTKIRLFFYSWMCLMVGHLDYKGIKRAKLYRTLPAYKYKSGQAFQLYLAEWLQNAVLNPLGQRIMLEMIDQLQQGSWDVLVPFCVHLSLRDFLNYRERLDWDNLFHMDQLIVSRVPAFYMVEYYVRDVTETLAKRWKTANELVKMISYQIFTNLPLPDGSPIRFRIGQALQAAAKDLGEARANKRGDPKVLRQFFIGFYRELATLASSKWLQTLADKDEDIIISPKKIDKTDEQEYHDMME